MSWSSCFDFSKIQACPHEYMMEDFNPLMMFNGYNVLLETISYVVCITYNFKVRDIFLLRMF